MSIKRDYEHMTTEHLYELRDSYMKFVGPTTQALLFKVNLEIEKRKEIQQCQANKNFGTY